MIKLLFSLLLLSSEVEFSVNGALQDQEVLGLCTALSNNYFFLSFPSPCCQGRSEGRRRHLVLLSAQALLPGLCPLPGGLPTSGAFPVGTRAWGHPAPCGASPLLLAARAALQEVWHLTGGTPDPRGWGKLQQDLTGKGLG